MRVKATLGDVECYYTCHLSCQLSATRFGGCAEYLLSKLSTSDIWKQVVFLFRTGKYYPGGIG